MYLIRSMIDIIPFRGIISLYMYYLCIVYNI